MSDGAELRLNRYQQDRITLTKESHTCRYLNQIREKCNAAFDNIKPWCASLSELSAKIIAINGWYDEIKKAMSALDAAQRESLSMLPTTKLDPETIHMFRTYEDPVPSCQKCISRIAPLVETLFVGMDVFKKFKVDFRLGYALDSKIELDGSLRMLCGSSNITFTGVQDASFGERFVRVFLNEMPLNDADDKKLALVIQLSMEITEFCSAKMIEIRCAFGSNEKEQKVMQAYQFERFHAANTFQEFVWRRDLSQKPPQHQILIDPKVAAIFKDFSLAFKES